MKLLILNRPKSGRERFDVRRFQKMVDAVEMGGLSAMYSVISTETDLEMVLEKEKPDLVYCANYYIKNSTGKKISIHKRLMQSGVDYIGSSPTSLELVLSKIELKEKWQVDDVPTPAFFKLQRQGMLIMGMDEAMRSAGYPYILKPDREGNSRGLDESSIVFDQAGFGKKVGELFNEYDTILVEQFLGDAKNIHEYTVAMIGNGEKRMFLPAEIKLKHNKKVRIVTTRDKDEHLTEALPVNDLLLRKRLARFAKQAFESAGVRDYSRCDLIMADNNLYAIEINGLPMIPDLWFEVCARGVGLDANQYLNAIVATGIMRGQQKDPARHKVSQSIIRTLPEPVMMRFMSA